MIILRPKNVIFERFWPFSKFHFPACSTLHILQLKDEIHVCLVLPSFASLQIQPLIMPSSVVSSVVSSFNPFVKLCNITTHLLSSSVSWNRNVFTRRLLPIPSSNSRYLFFAISRWCIRGLCHDDYSKHILSVNQQRGELSQKI